MSKIDDRCQTLRINFPWPVWSEGLADRSVCVKHRHSWSVETHTHTDNKLLYNYTLQSNDNCYKTSRVQCYTKGFENQLTLCLFVSPSLSLSLSISLSLPLSLTLSFSFFLSLVVSKTHTHTHTHTEREREREQIAL